MTHPQVEVDERPRTVVYLGNRNAIEVVADPDETKQDYAARKQLPAPTIRRKIDVEKACTTIILAPGLKLLDAAYDICHADRGVWQAHSDAESPAWVACTDPALGALLAAHWECEQRQPDPDGTLEDAAAESTTPAAADVQGATAPATEV